MAYLRKKGKNYFVTFYYRGTKGSQVIPGKLLKG